ncbi:unnamed protein product [Cuscuta campestris]|uniref:Uncharacterized protein n=1 Tax=Cuscuta campestris TaxID=132261 RepID=A0A484MN32_9ASTE|nr:unnamed protein product [Cuscuta campestris]
MSVQIDSQVLTKTQYARECGGIPSIKAWEVMREPTKWHTVVRLLVSKGWKTDSPTDMGSGHSSSRVKISLNNFDEDDEKYFMPVEPCRPPDRNNQGKRPVTPDPCDPNTNTGLRVTSMAMTQVYSMTSKPLPAAMILVNLSFSILEELGLERILFNKCFHGALNKAFQASLYSIAASPSSLILLPRPKHAAARGMVIISGDDSPPTQQRERLARGTKDLFSAVANASSSSRRPREQ